jgi:formate dehydrogenase subunit gamma
LSLANHDIQLNHKNDAARTLALEDLMREWDADAASDVIAGLTHLDGAMLPILHALQERFGYVDAAAIPLVAEALNVSRAEVHGVISFYHDFRSEPAGTHVLKLCRAEACQSMGAAALERHLSTHHGLKLGDTTLDGRLTVEGVYCLGNCALSPAALLDDTLIGRLDHEMLDAIVQRAGEPRQ